AVLGGIAAVDEAVDVAGATELLHMGGAVPLSIAEQVGAQGRENRRGEGAHRGRERRIAPLGLPLRDVAPEEPTLARVLEADVERVADPGAGARVRLRLHPQADSAADDLEEPAHRVLAPRGRAVGEIVDLPREAQDPSQLRYRDGNAAPGHGPPAP